MFYPTRYNHSLSVWDTTPHVPRELNATWNATYVSWYRNTLQKFNLKTRKSYDVFDNGLLIIVLNHVRWFSSTLKYFEIMHREIFRNILYCGENPDGHVIKESENTTGIKVSFVSAVIKDGYYLYRCLMQASRMGYNVSGHMIIADDTILYTWRIPPLNSNQVWSQRIFNFTCSKFPKWPWYRRFKAEFDKSMYALSKNMSSADSH